MKANKEFGQLLFKMSRLIRDEMTFNCYAARLSMLQYHTLVFLKEKKKVQMNEIAEHFHIEMPTATSLLNKLVSLHLVKRTSDKKDRRIVFTALTKKGQEVLKEALQLHNKKVNMILGALSPREQSSLFKILQTVVANLEEQYER